VRRVILILLFVFYLFPGNFLVRAQEFTPDEKFARDEAIRDAKKAALEQEKTAAELEEMRLESEDELMRDQEQMQKETDLMRKELGEELSVLYRQAEMEAGLDRQTLEKADEQA